MHWLKIKILRDMKKIHQNFELFYTYKINENKFTQNIHSVSCYNSENILDFFQFYNNHKIYLFSVDSNNTIRAYIDIEDKEYRRLIRNKKLQKINKIS